ncbi:hypothetical protein BDN71DRAFT_967974 [Pleurotus eryngii]|uniref:C3H1-type domain-containing protein n=1 Tax=Pleurotus eryngii TaxID=5323 RepID=A0A9P5ZVU8_PLEER|nr:hypothetical protein BDN71DRAFT_967974 [Pleurotus eryngii]
MEYFRPQSASSAVRIVDPSTQNDRYSKNGPKDSVQRQCRNVMIYGSCKFQDKGCTFYHPPSAPDALVELSLSETLDDTSHAGHKLKKPYLPQLMSMPPCLFPNLQPTLRALLSLACKRADCYPSRSLRASQDIVEPATGS